MQLDYVRVQLEDGSKITKRADVILPGMTVLKDEPAVTSSGVPLPGEPAPATKAAATRRANAPKTSARKSAASTKTATPPGPPTTPSTSADAGAAPVSEEDSK